MAIFYDVHFHAMNLSHPNIMAFLKRLDYFQIFLSETRYIVSEVIGAPFYKWQAGPLANLLAMMDNDIGSFFIIVEFCLKRDKNFSRGIEVRNGDVKETYDKIVLIPLIMDFSYQGINKGSYFYNMPPNKPVVEQAIDLLNGIRKYCKYEMYQENNQYTLKKRASNCAPLFEIYPFMGINTRSYSKQEVEEMMKLCFEDYKGDKKSLFEKMGQFKGVGDDIKNIKSNFFAGIKLYPPLGFNPWPESDDKMPDDPNYDYKTEREKVEVLYEYSCNKNIPITVHCGELGYDVVPNSRRLTSPDKWEKVLKNSKYSKLKLNLAHFGQEKKWSRYLPETLSHLLPISNEWEEKIIKLIDKYDNVYTDFSFLGSYDDYYKHLARLIEKDPKLTTKLNSRVLFGSDFVINLLYVKSYNEYLEKFATTRFLTLDQKKLLCNYNPEKFLFNKPE